MRDKAFIIVLYESVCRLGEISSLKLKHVTFDDYGVIIIVDGKTGQRRLRLIDYKPLLRNWINNHPKKEDPDSCLWTVLINDKRYTNQAISIGGLSL